MHCPIQTDNWDESRAPSDFRLTHEDYADVGFYKKALQSLSLNKVVSYFWMTTSHDLNVVSPEDYNKFWNNEADDPVDAWDYDRVVRQLSLEAIMDTVARSAYRGMLSNTDYLLEKGKKLMQKELDS